MAANSAVVRAFWMRLLAWLCLAFLLPIGAETLGPFGPHAVQFLEDLGNKISQINGERRSKSFLFQSIGIAIQRGNASCVMGTTGSMGKLEELNYL